MSGIGHKIGKRNPRKAYPVDSGFFYAVAGNHEEGRLLECAVFLELRRRLRPGEEISYWKGRSRKEVDFLIRRGSDIREAIQVCYDMIDPKTMAREVDALTRCLDELKASTGKIIAMRTAVNGPGDESPHRRCS